MANKVLYFQQNSIQNDTIKPIDSTGTKKSFTQKVLRYHQDNQKDTLIKLIEQGYDATSYIYSFAGEPVPLSDKFLNSKYFKSYNKHKTYTEKNTTTSINKSNNNSILSHTDYLLIILLLLASAVGFVRINTRNFLNRLFNSVVSFSFSGILYNERNRLFQLNDLILLIVFYISTGIVLVSVLDSFNFELAKTNTFIVYFVFSLAIFFAVQGYKLTIIFFGKFFDDRKNASEYLFYFNNILKLLSILNVIILFGILFAPENTRFSFVLIILFIFLIAYLLRVYKIISIFLTNRFSLFYLILYFCALEIIPILILGKLFLGVYHDKIF